MVMVRGRHIAQLHDAIHGLVERRGVESCDSSTNKEKINSRRRIMMMYHEVLALALCTLLDIAADFSFGHVSSVVSIVSITTAAAIAASGKALFLVLILESNKQLRKKTFQISFIHMSDR